MLFSMVAASHFAVPRLPDPQAFTENIRVSWLSWESQRFAKRLPWQWPRRMALATLQPRRRRCGAARPSQASHPAEISWKRLSPIQPTLSLPNHTLLTDTPSAKSPIAAPNFQPLSLNPFYPLEPVFYFRKYSVEKIVIQLRSKVSHSNPTLFF